jgi:hypothetical protein
MNVPKRFPIVPRAHRHRVKGCVNTTAAIGWETVDPLAVVLTMARAFDRSQAIEVVKQPSACCRERHAEVADVALDDANLVAVFALWGVTAHQPLTLSWDLRGVLFAAASHPKFPLKRTLVVVCDERIRAPRRAKRTSCAVASATRLGANS